MENAGKNQRKNNEKRNLYMSKQSNQNYPRKVFSTSLAVLCALFVAICSILYILYKSWSAKLDFEKWKDYDECGI